MSSSVQLVRPVQCASINKECSLSVKPRPVCRAVSVKNFCEDSNRFHCVNNDQNTIREMIICEAMKNKICEANHIGDCSALALKSQPSRQARVKRRLSLEFFYRSPLGSGIQDHAVTDLLEVRGPVFGHLPRRLKANDADADR